MIDVPAVSAIRAYAARIGCTFVAWAMLASLPASAHEYWIDVDDFTVSPGEAISARLKVGQMMEGLELPRLSRQIKSFQYFAPVVAQDAEGREGDRPALIYEAKATGLHIIAQETLPLEVTFDTFEEFEEYLYYEGLERFAAAHLERNLPTAGFTEAYARFAKALVQVGPVGGQQQDRQLGLAFEITALRNPYAGLLRLPVQLTWMGLPEKNTQISVFRQKGGEVERTLINTDTDGKAVIPLHQDGGRYLLNAVHLEPAFGGNPVWQSSWASLTFEAPTR